MSEKKEMSNECVLKIKRDWREDYQNGKKNSDIREKNFRTIVVFMENWKFWYFQNANWDDKYYSPRRQSRFRLTIPMLPWFHFISSRCFVFDCFISIQFSSENGDENRHRVIESQIAILINIFNSEKRLDYLEFNVFS